MIDVVIIEDQNLFAEGFKNLIGNIDDVNVTAIFRNGAGIVEKLAILQPHVLFLDLNLPKKNGIDILKQLRDKFPNMIIAVLTMYEDPLLIKLVKSHQANAYLSKDATLEELKHVMFSNTNDPFYVNKKLNLIDSPPESLIPDSFVEIAKITSREKEVIKLIAKGKSTEEISTELFISFETVKTHRKNIFKKLNINKVHELIKFAYDNNLL